MKIVAWLLGIAAIVGSCALAVDWGGAAEGERITVTSVERFSAEISAWQLKAQLRLKNGEGMFQTPGDQFLEDSKIAIARAGLEAAIASHEAYQETMKWDLKMMNVLAAGWFAFIVSAAFSLRTVGEWDA